MRNSRVGAQARRLLADKLNILVAADPLCRWPCASYDLTAIWRKSRRFIIHRVLHADDTPHRIALGIGIGIFVGLTPTIGLQMIIAGAMAVALRANKLVCIPMVWITNTVTLVPIYAACFSLGNALMGQGAAKGGGVAVGHIQSLAAETQAGPLSRILTLSFWQDLVMGITRVGAELWLGCLIVAVVGGALAYSLSRWGVVTYRERHESRLKARRLRRSRKRFPGRVAARGTSA